jgi:hypothetical protein
MLRVSLPIAQYYQIRHYRVLIFYYGHFDCLDTWNEDADDFDDDDENSIFDWVANDVADSCMNDALDDECDSDLLADAAIADDAVALLEDRTSPDPRALVEDAKSVLAIAADCCAH